MQLISKILPDHLPKSMRNYRDKYEHHLILKMGGEGVEEARSFLKEYFATHGGAFFECNAEETQAAMLHRFAVASAAIRYRSVHDDEVEDLVALDIALRRDDRDWFETLPPEIDNKSSINCITDILCVMCSIRTTSLKKATTVWLWNMKCSICLTNAVRNILPSIMSVICMKPSLN